MRTAPSARFYELMSISVPDGTPEELIATSEAIAGYVTAAGGRVLRSSNESPWGRRRLAYPIRHESADLRDGFYTLYHFEIEPNRIEDIEREIRLNERIIRHLLLTLDGEPVFVEEVEEVTSETNPATGETVVTDETVVVAEDPATGEVESVVVIETVDVDAAGEIEAVSDEVQDVVTDAAGEVEAESDDVEIAVVDAEAEVEDVTEDTEAVVAEEK